MVTSMIVGFFLSVILSGITFIVNLLPSYAFPSEIPTGISYFWGYVNLFSMIIPVGTIAVLFVVMTVFYGAEGVWNAAHWVLRRLKR